MVAAHPLGFIELVPLAIGAEDLVLLVWALAAMLVVGAGWILMAVVFEVFGNISIFGSHPFALAAGLLKAAMDKLGQQFMRYLDPIGHFFYGLAMSLWRPLYVIGDTIAGLVTQILGVSQASQAGLADVRGALAAGLNREETIANQLFDAAEQHADNLLAQAEAYADQVSDGVLGDAEHLYNLAEGDIVNSAAATRAYADQVTAGVLSDAEHLYNLAEGDIVNSLAEAKAYADQVGNGVLSDAEHLYNLAEGDIANARVSAVAEAVAEAVAQVQPQLSKIQTQTDECLEPLCDTVTPQAPRLGRLGNLLQGLEDLAVEAVILALAAECMHNPGAVVSDVSSVVQDVGGGAVSGIRDLIGA
jgi:hypothetical protein